MATNNTKQAAWVSIGSVVSFGFGIISSMVLSRYFTKADYGTYKQVLYVYDTMLIVFTLGLPRAYSFFLPRVDISEAISLIKKISALFIVMGLIMSTLLFVSSDMIATVLKNEELSSALKIFAIVPTFLLPTMGLDGILATYKRARMMAVYNISTKCLLLAFVTLPVLLFNFSYREAIIGFVIASAISFILAEILIFFPFRNVISKPCSISYKNIFSFSLPLLFASLWATLQNSADSFFISRYFGKEIFAEFANGNMELPFVGMIIGACATVLSPVFSRASQNNCNPQNDIMPIWLNVFEKSAMIIYPLVLYSIFFADYLMVFLYGPLYSASSVYFQIRTLSSFFNVIAIGPLLINIGYVKFYSNVQMIVALTVVLFQYLSVISIHSPYAISAIQLICRISGTIAYLLIIAKYFKVSFKDLFPIKNLSFIFVISIAILSVIKYFMCYFSFNVDAIYMLIISFCLYMLTFLSISKYIKVDYYKIISSFRK